MGKRQVIKILDECNQKRTFFDLHGYFLVKCSEKVRIINM
jgi:hypothetical protein